MSSTLPLKTLIRYFKSYHSYFSADMAGAACFELKLLVMETFKSNISPEGDSWEPLVDGSGRDPIRNLWPALVFESRAGKILVFSRKWYSVFHQMGTVRMAQRNFLPDVKISKPWLRRLEKAMMREFQLRFNAAMRSV